MASNGQPDQIDVPNTRGKHIGLNAAWINHRECAFFAFGNVKSKRNTQKPEPDSVVEINLLKPDFILAEPTMRSLMHECGRVFYTLQQRRYGLIGGQTQTIDFVDLSQQYRSCLRRALNRLNTLLEAEQDTKPDDSLIRMLYSIECVWHLVEFLILDSNSSSGAVVSSLLEWIRYHFPGPAREATEMLQASSRDVDKSDRYWPVVKGLILQGQTMIARTLLRVHPNAVTHCFEATEQLLQSLPVYSVHDGLSVHKYKTQWQCWRDKVRMLIAAGNFGAEPHLEEVLRLVTGDRAAWREQVRGSSCWYEHLPGFILYTDSTCRYYQLSQYANDWMVDFVAAQGRPGFTFLDKLILAVMDNNLPEVIQQLQQFPDNQWCAVHVVNLLFHAGLLDPGKSAADHGGKPTESINGSSLPVPDGKLIHDSLLYDFGCLLMSEGTHWLLGLDYLEFSTSEGLGAREALLGRVPIRHETQALKIIAVARKNNFPSVVTEVSKVLTKRNLALSRYGSALEWAIRSRDSTYVRDVANIILEHYCNHGEVLCEPLIANLGSKMFVSSRLVFLRKYYDFRQLYQQQEYAKAAEQLVSLMESKIVPSYFWSALMADVLPLLEFSEPIIPSAETYIVLDHLQSDLVPMLQQRERDLEDQKQQQVDLRTGAKHVLEPEATSNGNTHTEEPMEEEDLMALVPKFSSNLLNNCTEDLVGLVRLACMRNLSRAVLIEGLRTE